MPRTARIAPGGIVFHVLNRSSGRLKLFGNDEEFAAFDQAIERTLESCPMRICAYTVMPNHWHFVLWPEKKGELGAFMQKLSITHVRNWQVDRRRIGQGHVYQDRYRSFPIEASEYFYHVVRYVEQNALRAGLVDKADEWRWSSLWRRVHGKPAERKCLADWPLPMPRGWKKIVNTLQPEDELEHVRQSVTRGRPYGGEAWSMRTASRLGLESSFRPRGRPRKVAEE